MNAPKHQTQIFISRLIHVASAIALTLLFVTSLTNQAFSQNKQVKSWNLEVSTCQAPSPQTQDDQPWADNSTTLPCDSNRQADKPSNTHPQNASNRSYSLSIRAPPHIS
ncbi:hypothetical protein R50072_20550 [Simiduia litorea]|uniref:hypothetical protein n=1 Tax=Simiduia litorea TaxID=1435348 RepID=UPI0036F3763F